MPVFSVVIPAYDDWVALGSCLRSLSQQTGAPEFEVIVVDDDSEEAAPEGIRQWAHSLSLTIVRQSHAGVSSARNRGIQISKGSTLLFVDADCRLQADCLAALDSIIAASPQHSCFQLQLVGDGSGIVGRAEALRLITLQNHLLQTNGCIRYLNTAAFAIRRARVNVDEGLFDPVAIRAEDTLLLANLIEAGELPFFVPSAMVTHAISLSIAGCLRKDARSAYLERAAYDVMASKRVKIRMSNHGRLRMLSSTWKVSGQRSIGRSAWFLLAARQSTRLIVRWFADVFGIRPRPQVPPARTEA